MGKGGKSISDRQTDKESGGKGVMELGMLGVGSEYETHIAGRMRG